MSFETVSESVRKPSWNACGPYTVIDFVFLCSRLRFMVYSNISEENAGADEW